MPTSSPLPPRQSALFKRILKCYEQKQYKNGLKCAKQILSNPKFAEHGETLAMKGLTLNCLGRKEEAYELVRKGLRNDLRSHVCWHVFGLLQRSDHKYDEAIKCYRNALKWDKDNLQILRDLSLLQIQTKDLEGYKDTRYQLLVLRPAQRASWIGYSISFHLLKEYDMAIKILDEFRKTQPVKMNDYEHSEMLLYQVQMLEESNCPQEALTFIDNHNQEIIDRLSIQEIKARLLLKLGQKDEALVLYHELLERNSECWAYYTGIENSMPTPYTEEERLKIYSDAASKYPYALSPKRLTLNFTSGEVFKKLADNVLKSQLVKGVPPLFVNMRSLYTDKEKVGIFEELLLSYVESLKTRQTFSESEDIIQTPTVLLWTYYYLAQHYDYLKDTEKALIYINDALDHTVTLIELYMVKARIYKHAGDIHEAVHCLDEAQSLDTADRYINYKCAKYMLRANLVNEAELMCAKFTREGVSAMSNLEEMQCMWFECECAAAYQRLSQYGDALKKCHEVARHFSDIVEDQFDFHTYCLRKMTLRAYVGLLRLEDVLRSHPFYYRCAKIAIEIYIKLYDLKNSKLESIGNEESVTPEENVKLKNGKARKVVKKDGEKKKNAKNADVDTDGPQRAELIPEELEKPSDPLEEAIYFLKPLQMLSSSNITTHLLAFEIYYRKDKYLLMLQAIKKGYKINSNHPLLHQCIIRYLTKVTSFSNWNESIRIVIQQSIEELFDISLLSSIDCASFNEVFMQNNELSAPHRLSGAAMQYLLDPSKQQQSIKYCTSLDNNLQDLTMQHCVDVLTCMRNGMFGECKEAEETYRKLCLNRYPYCLALLSLDEQELRHQALVQKSLQSTQQQQNGSTTSIATLTTTNSTGDMDCDLEERMAELNIQPSKGQQNDNETHNVKVEL